MQGDDPTKLARKLALDFAYHSSWFEPVEQRFMADVGNLETSPPAIPVVSTVTGELNTSFGAQYWWRNLRFPVQYQAAIETALAMGGDTFIELGPHRTLSSMTAGCAANQGRDVVTISTLYRQWDDFESLATALGDVYVNGIDIDWQGVFGAHAGHTVDLPCQPWINKQLWIEPRETAQTLRPSFWHPLLGTLDLSPTAQWSNTLTLAQHSLFARSYDCRANRFSLQPPTSK